MMIYTQVYKALVNNARQFVGQKVVQCAGCNKLGMLLCPMILSQGKIPLSIEGAGVLCIFFKEI